MATTSSLPLFGYPLFLFPLFLVPLFLFLLFVFLFFLLVLCPPVLESPPELESESESLSDSSCFPPEKLRAWTIVGFFLQAFLTLPTKLLAPSVTTL